MTFARFCRLGLALGLVCLVLPVSAAEPLWKAGVAKADITPTQPLWGAGYAARTNMIEEKVTALWVKALALEDTEGRRGVFVTSDLLGIPQSIYQHTCASLKEKFSLTPDQIILSASHTHCAPVLRGALYDAYPFDESALPGIEKYSAELEVKIVETIARAIADLAPARLAAGQGTTAFAVNRRNNNETNVSELIAQGALQGPVDHSVPVLAVLNPDGDLKAVLFGYACHNTVMDFYKWSGDYAGFAQIALERSHPGATAMFFMGCGGDQNPLPRRKPQLPERYGNMLAAAVEEVLLSHPRTLAPDLRTTMEMLTLHLGPAPTEDELEKLTNDPAPPTQRWAARMLAQLKSGKPFVRDYQFPLQAWMLGGRQLLITLGGEPVVDYALRFKQRFGPQTWVAGYCNDVMNYIPSRRVLNEDKPPLAHPQWGYEGAHATMIYGQPAYRWADEVEDLIDAGAERVVTRVRIRE
jgi:neutral ceramidase